MNKEKLSDKIKKIRGIIKTKKDFDYKKVLQEELSKNYGV